MSRPLKNLDDAKIRVLYPPVDSARFSSVDDGARVALRASYGFGEHETVLLFPSSSHERKGLPLIESVVNGMDLPVVVAVAGRPPERTSAHVRYIGYVKDLENAYRAADFTILASKYEPFGLVGIESAMCGTPVILSSNIGCFGAIADARTRYAGAATPNEKAAAASEVESAFARLLVVMESYPQLQSSQNVLALQSQIEGTENRISTERGRYNEDVRAYNLTASRFPSSLVAGAFGFGPRSYFEAAAGTEVAPVVSF